jgi:hypothetical protein
VIPLFDHFGRPDSISFCPVCSAPCSLGCHSSTYDSNSAKTIINHSLFDCLLSKNRRAAPCFPSLLLPFSSPKYPKEHEIIDFLKAGTSPKLTLAATNSTIGKRKKILSYHRQFSDTCVLNPARLCLRLLFGCAFASFYRAPTL